MTRIELTCLLVSVFALRSALLDASCVSYIDLIPSGFWVLIVCGVLLLLTLYFLARASTTDPGIFLRLPPEGGYKCTHT